MRCYHSIHGCEGEEKKAVEVGGRDKSLRNRVNKQLKDNGFPSEVVCKGDRAGICKRNICNRGYSGEGVQLEITEALRKALRTDDECLESFAFAVKRAIEQEL